MSAAPRKWFRPRWPSLTSKRGSRVFIGTGCGEPQHLIRAMVKNEQLQDIMLYQMMSSTFADYVDDPGFVSRFNLKLFFISKAMRKAAFEGKD